MAGKPEVLSLLEEMLESGQTAEQVCKDCLDLLPEVRRRWKSFRLVDSAVAALLPDPEATGPPGGPMPPHDPAQLPQIPGYRMEALIGQGGMGVVYRAWHIRLNRAVALKMLSCHTARQDDLKRFMQEAEAVAALHHPNIVQVYDVGDVQGRPYFTMELIEGGNLADQIRGIPQPAQRAATLVASLAEAIYAAHQHGILHRDLKPSNILLERDGTPKVTDFGLARRLQTEGDLTLSGVPMGTPSYMAPEQARGDRTALGPATDVYALGAILYELLTGRPPFRGESTTATLQQVVDVDPVPPIRLNPAVARDLQTISLKCLNKEPSRRYANAHALAEDLGRFLRGEPVLARPVGTGERVWKWMRRRPALAGMVVALALHVVGLSVGSWLLYRNYVFALVKQAQTDREVHGFLDRAHELLNEGWPAADLSKVIRASTLASRADDLARREAASAKVRQEAEALSTIAASQIKQLENDRALLEALEDVQVAHQPLEYGYNKANWSIVLTLPSAGDEYALAFRRWGLDVDGTAEDEAAARLGAEPNPVLQEVIAALDGWMLLRLRNQPVGDWRRLFRLADRLDESPRRRQLRALVVNGAPLRAAPVAGLVGLRPPWLALWELGPGSSRWALLELRKDIAVRTEPAPTLVLLASAFTDVGDLAGAEDVLREAVAVRPQEVLLLAALAKLLERQGPSRIMDAIGYFRAAYSRSRHQGLALSRALLLAGRSVEAEELLRELGRNPPHDRNATLPYYLGKALMDQQRYSEAEAASRESLRLRPDWAPALSNLAAVLGLQQKYGPAEGACRKAIALDPSLPEAYTNLGCVLVRQGKYEEAEAASRKAVALKPEAANWNVLGTALSGQGKPGEAETAFRKAIDLNPGHFVARYNLGNALGAQSRFREAEAVLRAAIALKPDDSDVYNNLGASLLDQKKYAAAEVAFRKSLALKPEDGMTFRNLGIVLLRQARFDEASASLRKVSELLPDSSSICRHARHLDHECKSYQALDARSAAILRGTEQLADALEQLQFAQLCLYKKHYAAAARFYQAAFAADPKLAEKEPGLRYEAAIVASLAGTGQGQDAADSIDTERTRWRQQALAWLRQDLSKWDEMLPKANAKVRKRIQQAIEDWQADENLAGLRDPDSLVKLPQNERAECVAFWNEVAALGNRARTKQ